MKNWLPALLFWAIAAPVFCQTIISKWHGLGGHTDEVLLKTRATDDAILVVGWAQIGRGNDKDWMLRCLDTAGRTRFFLNPDLPGEQIGYDACSDGQGNFIVCGADVAAQRSVGSLWRVGATGEILEQRVFAEVDSFASICRTAAGGFAVVGRGRDSAFVKQGICFFNFSGNSFSDFQRTFNAEESLPVFPRKIVEMPHDHQFLVLADEYPASYWTYFKKFGKGGGLVFERFFNFSESVADVAVDSLGRWLLFCTPLGNSKMLRIVEADGLKWVDFYVQNLGAEEFPTILEAGKDSVVAVSVSNGLFGRIYSKWVFRLSSGNNYYQWSPGPEAFVPGAHKVFAFHKNRVFGYQTFLNEWRQKHYNLSRFDFSGTEFKTVWQKKFGVSEAVGSVHFGSYSTSPTGDFWVTNEQIGSQMPTMILKTDRRGEAIIPLKINPLNLGRDGYTRNFFARKKIMADGLGGVVMAYSDDRGGLTTVRFDKNG